MASHGEPGGTEAQTQDELDTSISASPLWEKIEERCRMLGYSLELSSDNPWHAFVTYPSGDSTRTLDLTHRKLAPFLSTDLSKVRLSNRFDGYWDPNRRFVEVATTAGSPILSRDLPWSAEVGGLLIRIDTATSKYDLLMNEHFEGLTTTLQISNIQCDQPDFDRKIERITDSLFFDLNWFSRLDWAPREPPWLPDRPFGVRPLPEYEPNDLLINQYLTEPVALYRTAQVEKHNPLWRYWSYYQVLEYFFPTGLTKLASSVLSSDTFDITSDDCIMDLLRRTGAIAGNQAAGELRALEAVVGWAVTQTELEKYLVRSGLEEVFASQHGVIPGFEGPYTIESVCRRLYNIRNAIVHSKDHVKYPLNLIPGAEADRKVRRELCLVEYLAGKAIRRSAAELVVD